MNDQDLATLLKNLESDRVERKASISDRGKLRQAICAFANDLANHQKPGVFFIGINIQNPGGPFGQVTCDKASPELPIIAILI